MSWQLPAFALLAAVLIAGFWWYERDRPPSQVVALVAALAAISVAGRVMLSPVPNVVPVTDIALITGYALGPAPGFAVGALSALVSNLWLGQGPWTPWQMAGWGLVGLGGAWLALLSRRRIGRLALAAACGLAGLLYGALLDLSLMVSYGGEQSLDRYLALSARGIPFNLAHAAGNFALALAVGPALIAMLSRFRRRFEFAWSPAAAGGAAAALAIAVALGGGGGGSGAPGAQGPDEALAAPTASAAAASPALAWLRDAQNPDGGYADTPGEESHPAMAGWAALGLAASGINPREVRSGGPSLIAYLKADAAAIRTIGDIERTVLVVRAAGLDPRRFAGRDLVAELLRYRRPNGSWPGGVNPTAFGILALRAAGLASPASARWLGRAQADGGGWGFAPGSPPDADSTGAAIQALAASGRGAGAIRRGVGYLRSSQRRNGGWALAGGGANAQSTAFALQGLTAAGISPGAVRTGGRSGIDYLDSLRAGDGHYRYSRSSDQTPVWVTAQALAAVSGEPFPLEPVPMRRKAAAAPAASEQSSGAGARDRRPGAKGPARRGAPKPGTQGEPKVRVKAAREAAQPRASGAASSARGAGALPWAVGGGMAALIAALTAGWFVYRRRLPG